MEVNMLREQIEREKSEKIQLKADIRYGRDNTQ